MTAEAQILVGQIKLATDYQTNKTILREKIQSDLHMPHNGGLFKITLDLLSFLTTWPDKTLYLEDTYQNPIEIDRDSFLTAARQHYQKVMNYWHLEHAELKKLRKL